MSKDFIPRTDAGLLEWVNPFSAKISLTPTAYGLLAANATALASKVSSFSTALTAATDPALRGKSTILAKDTARTALVSYCRQLARAIQGTLTVTNQQRQDLGLSLRGTLPTPVPAPASWPVMETVSVSGNTAHMRMHDSVSTTRRGRPEGVDGAAVFSFVGAEPPSNETDWTFEGNTTKTVVDIVFPSTVEPGTKVWFTAFWYNPRAQRGPASTPISTNLPGGGAMSLTA